MQGCDLSKAAESLPSLELFAFTRLPLASPGDLPQGSSPRSSSNPSNVTLATGHWRCHAPTVQPKRRMRRSRLSWSTGVYEEGHERVVGRGIRQPLPEKKGVWQHEQSKFARWTSVQHAAKFEHRVSPGRESTQITLAQWSVPVTSRSSLPKLSEICKTGRALPSASRRRSSFQCLWSAPDSAMAERMRRAVLSRRPRA